MKKIMYLLMVVFLMGSMSACASKYNAPEATAPSQSGQMGGSQSDSGTGAYPGTQTNSGAKSIANGLPMSEGSFYPNEEYLAIRENKEVQTNSESMLTFSLKVDTASYSNVQRYIESGSLPPADAVKTEELINYFRYEQDMAFSGNEPFSIYTELGASPFSTDRVLAFVRVKAKEIDKAALPRMNLTFLIDTSGSMDSYDKLPLLKNAFSLLIETLGENDKVSLVTYAGSSAVLLDSVSGADKKTLQEAIDSLMASGSTAGADGILTAYKLAEKNFIANGNNRVILATDGDFNVGLSGIEELEQLIAKKRDSGVYLSILGFGTDNLKDNRMETLSKHGNGNYSYINSAATAKKVLVDELSANLFTIADDVKAQVEFNPNNVKSYRLIGYENRALRNEDFNDDTKDAGEIGIGTDVVLLFELELNSGASDLSYKYQNQNQEQSQNQEPYQDELFEVRIRYKDPGQSESKLITTPVSYDRILQDNSSDFRFAASVAAFGHILRGSDYMQDIDIADVIWLAESSAGRDVEGYRYSHIKLLKQLARLMD